MSVQSLSYGTITDMTEYHPHPATSVFPMMESDAFTQLVADIRANGLQKPITVYEGQVLNGRSRLLACGVAGVKPLYREAKLAAGETPIDYIVKENLAERDLNRAQRIALAYDMTPYLAQEAGQTLPRITDAWKPGPFDLRAAQLFGVGWSSIRYIRAIEHRNSHILDQMRAGEFRSMAQAARAAGYGAAIGNEPIDDALPPVYFGKGDRWKEATEPLKRYIAGWDKRDYKFRHVPPKEARKRLALIEELREGLASIEADLEQRSHSATLRVKS